MLGSRFGTSEGLDAQVQGTNDDAQISKLSCSRAGYFKDDFVHHFVRKPVRRSPLINRGYYSRYAALRLLLKRFLDVIEASGSPAQVLVLGAGFDTAWFQLAAAGQAPHRFLELDFKQVTHRKVGIIQQHPALWDLVSSTHSGTPLPAPGATPNTSPLGPPRPDQPTHPPPAAEPQPQPPQPPQPPPLPRGPSLMLPPPRKAAQPSTPVVVPDGAHVDAAQGELITSRYAILPADLRDIPAVEAAIVRAGLAPSLPTYVLSECVLVYMEPAASTALLSWAARYFSQAVVAIYEQIKPEDAFGRQMVSNLEARGCPVRGLPATPSLQAHCERLVSCGWHAARAWDMDAVYKWHLDAEDKNRIEALEVFDEFEEWHLIQEHYSISLGATCPGAGAGQAAGLLDAVGFGQAGCVQPAVHT